MEDIESRLNEYRWTEQLALKDRALAAASEGITISDARLPDNPLIYANSGFEKLTGYPVESIIGKNCRFLQGPGSDPSASEEIRRALREQRDCVVEILNYHRDGTPFWNRLSITPVRDTDRKVTHYIGVQTDITARKNAEAALRLAKEELEVANNRMKTELEMAARIQRTMLPPVHVSLQGANISWIFHPCDELAGDTLNFIALDGERVVLYVIDVSGHGVGAALLSVTLHHLLAYLPAPFPAFSQSTQNASRFDISSPSDVARQLNRLFPMDSERLQYFSMIYGILHLRSGQFKYVSAGHPAPLVLPRDGSPILLSNQGFPIGLFPDVEYQEESVVLNPGDRLFLYTDGFTETSDNCGQEYGVGGLLGAIAAGRSLSIQDTLNGLVDTLKCWCQNQRFSDDLSMLGVEYTGET
jgi:sigma-B regulation protein RsbU (phosphoserine phosphatase)